MKPDLVTKDFQRSTFSVGDRRVVRALGEALFAVDDPRRLESFVDDVDAFVSPASRSLRFGLVLLLHVIAWTPIFFGRWRTFPNLDREERVHHLERLERSGITQLPLLVVAYKTVMSMLFYEDERELRALGYPGPDRKRWLRTLPPSAHAAAARTPVGSEENHPHV